MNNRSKGNENKREGGYVLRMTQPERTDTGGHINTPLMSHENKCVCVCVAEPSAFAVHSGSLTFGFALKRRVK